ncbi:hypothetical protein BDF20DRAFT_995971 [Mycotypha africana]|uniref:uncharacterized protein n=1 Tax=Mycotypha africana TaxID=64632 RepID=UPI002301CDBD|nr:uncharacterized protein BDF20DRAFT_995971 [Mycotypha africana]KAI8970432.1 hypothetical protein BDF20DRAFT_995971 [Mycotypha africana]
MTAIHPTASPISSPYATNQKQTTAVQVALRVRPLTQQDRSLPKFSNSSDADVIKTYENTVVIVPHQKSFQFDYVFNANSTQAQVFDTVVAGLIDKFIDGYNVTILAYGQTSSGKTYTMGTALENQTKTDSDHEGIIPRAISMLFQQLLNKKNAAERVNRPTAQKASIVVKRNPSALATFPPNSGLRIPKKSTSTASLKKNSSNSQLSDRRFSATSSQQEQYNKNKFSICVSFVEIYNEELIDLLDSSPPHERPPLAIREDAKGQIIWTGFKEVYVESSKDVLKYLQMGTENRATGSTDMNLKSSRSHAIFSVTLKQEKWVSASNRKGSVTKIKSLSSLNSRQNTINVKDLTDKHPLNCEGIGSEDGEWITTQSKFHFVDLAGSERLKKTAAQGDRRKEGISINAGLLALGNVISALSDPMKKSSHVPYRDSKLTRLLQDSLGGNSTTVMIACVSPSEVNLTETTNTIKYAYRARNIRNKVEKNEAEEWMVTDNVDHLRQIINKLKAELRVLKSNTALSKSPNYNENVHLGMITPSSSSITDTERRPSTCPSISITTAHTVPDQFTSAEMCDSPNQQQQNGNEIAIMVADLRRQIEELQNELIVTRERNRLVERELRQQHRKKKRDSQDFQHLVEPVIEEYEKSISVLESQLAKARAALTHSDQALEEQQSKVAEYEIMHANEVQVLEDLRARLSTAIERERSSEAYCLELEAQLEKSINEGNKDQKVLSELREKVMKFKEMDEHTEQYINDLEARLSAAEKEKIELLQKWEGVNGQREKEEEDLEEKSEEKLRESKATISDLTSKCELREKQLAQCQSTCDKLNEKLRVMKQDPSTSSNKLHTEASTAEITELMAQVKQKEEQLHIFEMQLRETSTLKEELNSLHLAHSDEIMRLQNSLSDLKTKHQQEITKKQSQSQKLQNSITALKETHKNELSIIQQKLDTLQQQKQQQDEAFKKLTLSRQQDVEKLKIELNALQLVEEKQDYIIQGLENKVAEMDHLIASLHTQLNERDQTIQFLEADNASKAKKFEIILKDLCGMKDEKNVMKDVMSFVEGTLKQQEAKSEKALTTLIREHEIEEKRQTLNVLSQATQRLSQDDELTRNSLTQQTDLVAKMKEERAQTELEQQKLQALQAQIEHHKKANEEKQQELTQIEQNEQMSILNEERSIASLNDTNAIIEELRKKVTALQQTRKKEDELWREELFMTRKENRDYKSTVETLRKLLSEAEQKLLEKEVEETAISINKETISDGDMTSKLGQFSDLSREQLITKMLQLQDDYKQLTKTNDNLVSQLILQKGQSSLETKNFELELMKLTAANDRLEKEMDQLIPRTNTQNREAMHFTSPPNTPRMNSPLPSSANSNMAQCKSYHETSNLSISKLSKSGSYRSVSSTVTNDAQHFSDEETLKRLSFISNKSDTVPIRSISPLRNSSRSILSSSVLPPPTAPPSNPLPPIPTTPLPPTPCAPSSPSLSNLSEPSADFPSLPSTQGNIMGSVSTSSLHRRDSSTSATFSDLISTLTTAECTNEQYHKLIRSLQRKVQIAETDIRAHQEIISRLETQLSRSETSVREAKKQLDVVNREKQAYNLEVQNLRTQITQIQSEQKIAEEESLSKRKHLEAKIEEQKALKEKAEKARRILENRMDELMNKKSKFMCF